MTLTYTPADGITRFVDQWLPTGCLDLGVITLGGGIGDRHCYVNFYGFCASGTVTFKTRSWYAAVDPGGCVLPATNENSMVITSFTCAPFHIHHAVSGFDNFPASVLNEGGFTSVDFDSTESTAGACSYIFNVQGCGFRNVQGATISLWTNGAKTTSMGTATTDVSGNGTVISTLRVSNPYFEVSGSRFVTSSGTGNSPTTASSVNVTLTEATGYHCTGFCAWPEPTTMHATHPVFGAITFTWSGGNWVSTVSYAYPGNIGGGGSCVAKTVTVTCTWDGGSNYAESWKYDGTDCPDDTGGSTATASWNDDVVSCYVPSVSAFSKTFTFTPAAGREQNLYGVGALSLAIAE